MLLMLILGGGWYFGIFFNFVNILKEIYLGVCMCMCVLFILYVKVGKKILCVCLLVILYVIVKKICFIFYDILEIFNFKLCWELYKFRKLVLGLR